MFILNVYFCCELRFVATYAPNSDFYSEIQELTQILLRISEEKIGSWGLCMEYKAIYVNLLFESLRGELS